MPDPIIRRHAPLPPLPDTRDFPFVCCSNSAVFVLGGLAYNNGVEAVIRMTVPQDLNFQQSSWETITSLPRLRVNLGCVYIEDKLVVIGGNAGGSQGPQSGSSSPWTDVYDVSANIWTQGPDASIPMAMPALAVVGRTIYAFSNFCVADGMVCSGYASLDMSTMTWSPPQRLDNLATEQVQVIGGKIYMLVGGACRCFDPATGTWSNKAGFPGGRTIGSIVVGSNVMVFSAVAYDRIPVPIWLYDTVADSWRQLPQAITTYYGYSFSGLHGCGQWSSGSALYRRRSRRSSNGSIPDEYAGRSFRRGDSPEPGHGRI